MAYRVTRKSADLPEMVEETRYVTLDPQGMKIYESLETSLCRTAKGEVVVRNILTQLLRLQQVTGGFIRDDKVVRCSRYQRQNSWLLRKSSMMCG